MKKIVGYTIILIATAVMFLFQNSGIIPWDNIFSLSFVLENNQLEHIVGSLKNDDSSLLRTLSFIVFKVTFFTWMVVLVIKTVYWVKKEICKVGTTNYNKGYLDDKKSA